MSDENRIYVNGLDGSTGAYLEFPATAEEVAEVALKDSLTPGQLKILKSKWSRAAVSFGPGAGVNPKALDESGWGVLFAAPIDEAAKRRQDDLRAALLPLLEWRQGQAKGLFHEYTGDDAVKPGEGATAWLERHGSGPGPVDPTIVPYYLLIVADPEDLPFGFQYELDLDYAVGRIHFDTVEEYAAYARSVVQAEKTPRAPSREVVFFGTRHEGDVPTTQSADSLIGPLVPKLAGEKDLKSWKFQTLVGDSQATKGMLGSLMGGSARPDVLFTASHGLVFPQGNPMQLPAQGALVCQEWPGPKVWGNKPMTEDLFFAAADVADTADLSGLIAFLFACYGAGTPKLDDYPNPRLNARPSLASRSFLASLPRRSWPTRTPPAGHSP